MHSISGILTIAYLTSSAYALGINCRGSSFCNKNNAPSQLQSFISKIQCDRMYNNNEHIACISGPNFVDGNGGVCAFLQGVPGPVSGASIQLLIDAIVDHGCSGCGSTPVTFPQQLGGSNDPSAGILTVNFVKNTDNPCPTGLC
jgi:hypothetical protein